MNETEELKPCPFCGGEAHYDLAVERKSGYATYYAFCRYCGAETAMFSSIPEAIAAWNRRAEPERHGYGTPDMAGMGVVNGG